eukprot:2391518-Rhodomonas_salina.2
MPPVVCRQRVADTGLGVVSSSVVQGLALATTQHSCCSQERRWRRRKPNRHACPDLELRLGKEPVGAGTEGAKPGSWCMSQGPLGELHP